MFFDVIIVGGSFAGQAAALQLGRARQRVLLVDAKRPRNRFAHTSHGFLGQDGQPPSAIMATAARQLAAYATVERYEGEATDAALVEQGFHITLADGRKEVGKRLILATGARDILPDLPGLQERWGVSVLHCPYCHGYELEQRPIGVLASSDMALHQAMLVPDWGPTTLFTQGAFVPTPEQQAALAARGVRIERTPVAELLGASPALEAVRLADGRTVELFGLFLAPQTQPASDLAERLGCAFKDGPTGPYIAVDGRQQTSVPGVFAAGDAKKLSNSPSIWNVTAPQRQPPFMICVMHITPARLRTWGSPASTSSVRPALPRLRRFRVHPLSQPNCPLTRAYRLRRRPLATCEATYQRG